MEKTGWGRRAASFAGAVILAALALPAAASLWLMLGKLFGNERLPSVLGCMPVYVLSGSMEPAFSAGDMIVIRKKDIYEPGDTVTFESGRDLVTHRIVGQTVDGYITKGDANNTVDEELVPPERIAGSLLFVVPGAGRVFLFFRTKKGRMWLAAAVLFAMAGSVKGKRKVKVR